jgi:hypothetical protein
MNSLRKSYGLENKSTSFALKAIDIGNGGFEGHSNTHYVCDDGGDIVIAYEYLDDFIKNGFVPDAHGMGSGVPGGYTYGNTIGYPEEARVDDVGLYCKFAFHSDDEAQKIRTRMRERIDAQKSVSLSIGYDLTQPPIFIPREAFEKELPRFIPAKYLADCLASCKGHRQVRLIKVAINEVSPVPIPMNRNSLVTGVKSMNTKNLKVEIAGDQIKGQYLGDRIEESISMATLDRMHWRLYWYIDRTLYDDALSTDEKMENVRAACEEFASLVPTIIAAVYASLGDKLNDEIKQAYGTPEQPKVGPFELAKALSEFGQCADESVKITARINNLKALIERGAPVEETTSVEEISQTKAADLDEFEALELQNLQSINDIRISNHRKSNP